MQSNEVAHNDEENLSENTVSPPPPPKLVSVDKKTVVDTKSLNSVSGLNEALVELLVKELEYSKVNLSRFRN